MKIEEEQVEEKEEEEKIEKTETKIKKIEKKMNELRYVLFRQITTKECSFLKRTKKKKKDVC